jgi:hypothetical protein
MLALAVNLSMRLIFIGTFRHRIQVLSFLGIVGVFDLFPLFDLFIDLGLLLYGAFLDQSTWVAVEGVQGPDVLVLTVPVEVVVL